MPTRLSQPKGKVFQMESGNKPGKRVFETFGKKSRDFIEKTNTNAQRMNQAKIAQYQWEQRNKQTENID